MALALLDDPVPYVRAHAAQALGQIGSIEVAPSLAARLGDPDWPTQDAAKRALEHLGREVEGVVLEHLFDDNDRSRTGAAEVLQYLGIIERLLSQEARGPSDPKRRLWLGKLAEAGGVRVRNAVLANLPAAAPARVAGTGDRLEHAGAASEAEPD
jgi:HEAT repeat protein